MFVSGRPGYHFNDHSNNFIRVKTAVCFLPSDFNNICVAPCLPYTGSCNKTTCYCMVPTHYFSHCVLTMSCSAWGSLINVCAIGRSMVFVMVFITAGCGGFIHIPHILTSFEHHRSHFLAEWPPPCGTQPRLGNEEQQDTVLIEGGIMLVESHYSAFLGRLFIFTGDHVVNAKKLNKRGFLTKMRIIHCVSLWVLESLQRLEFYLRDP